MRMLRVRESKRKSGGCFINAAERRYRERRKVKPERTDLRRWLRLKRSS